MAHVNPFETMSESELKVASDVGVNSINEQLQSYIIGDIHGCFDTFIALIEKIPKGADIYSVGDLIDRGSNAKKVIQYMIDNDIKCIKGNHEVMFLEIFPDITNVKNRDREAETLFGNNGGNSTLYCYENDEETLKRHLSFLNSLPYYRYVEDLRDESNRPLLVSHSTAAAHINELLNENLNEIQKEHIENNIIWNRFIPDEDHGVFNVFGHTPISSVGYKYYGHYEFSSREPIIDTINGWANVDTGCCYNSFTQGYILTALAFPSMDFISQPNIEKGN